MEEELVELLKRREKTFPEIAEALRREGDLRPLRSLLAELVRRGVVERRPDYSRKKMVFTLKETVSPEETEKKLEEGGGEKVEP